MNLDFLDFLRELILKEVFDDYTQRRRGRNTSREATSIEIVT